MKNRMVARRNTSLDPRFDKNIPPTLDETSCFIAIIVHSISIMDFIDLDVRASMLYEFHIAIYEFIFSIATDGKIKAWLYDIIGSRVDYNALGHSFTRMAYRF
ncbi:hypothetical protein CTI12_AA391520 [Artemisia annua]|uniref:Uncharacterized protein n=1 Tax=Artemisia annua TaxID=35608 RepID=A0A2U1MDU1_ARTAN|nr:hypothetical protein CTI12_AA391520 [Artemisia annua]